MAQQVIQTPGGIAFAGFYYPDILRELLQFLRTNKDRIGLTDENDFEVHVQLLRAFALVGHLNNTRLDSVATEMFLDSAQLLESVKRMFRLVGIELSSATPAVALLVAKLSEVTTVNQTAFVPVLADWGTTDVPPIVYESGPEGVDLDRTDQVKYVYGLETTDSGSGNGSVTASSPDVFTRTSGTWGSGASDPTGSHLFVIGSIFDNGGEFRVTARLSDASVRVVRIPDSKEPAFTTETGLSWVLREFTSDLSASANAGSVYFKPWTSGFVGGDMLFVGHRQVMPTSLDIVHRPSVGFADSVHGVWEYFDDERSAFNPVAADGTTGVTDNGTTITFDCQALLGATIPDAEVRVTCIATGSSEVRTSNSNSEITTHGLLGQSPGVSVDPDDYLITSDWVPFANQSDGTAPGGDSFEADGEVTWDLPQTTDRSWLPTDVNLMEAYWIRFRIHTLGGSPQEPEFDRLRIDQGDQYIAFPVAQGETIGPSTIGSSDGSASQSFTLPETPFFDLSETIEVDEAGGGNWVEYYAAATFAASSATDRHYIVRVDASGQATIRFGNGINAKIPPAGVNNIRATYRIGGDVDGNVGIDQITDNVDGVGGITEVTNPRTGVGWKMKDGGDAADLERVKLEIPGTLRARGVAAKPEDVVTLAVQSFTDSDDSQPIARAWAEEEGFGVKTIKLIVVGDDGTTLTQTQLDEVDEYFNGDRYARPPVRGALLMNHKLTTVNFLPKDVSVSATVRWSNGSADAIITSLLSFLHPLAVGPDGVTYVWDFGSQVSYSTIHSLIHSVDPGIKDVPSLLIGATGVTPVEGSLDLGPNELPVTNASLINISIIDD